MAYSVIRTCPACGVKNRVQAGHLAGHTRCGSCKTTLAPQSEPIDVDPQAFADIVREARQPILVDFWAAWCGPCRMAAPEVREVAREMAGRALVLKVDTEKHPDLGARFNVQAIPNFIVLRDGRVVAQHPGLVSRQEMRRWLAQASEAGSRG